MLPHSCHFKVAVDFQHLLPLADPVVAGMVLYFVEFADSAVAAVVPLVSVECY